MKRVSEKMAIGMPDEPLVWCPGCECLHRFNVNRPNEVTGARWTWNGNIDSPTFSPSLVFNNVKGEGTRCHSFLRDGVWEFLQDCTHSLAGQKVPLPDLPPWVR